MFTLTEWIFDAFEFPKIIQVFCDYVNTFKEMK